MQHSIISCVLVFFLSLYSSACSADDTSCPCHACCCCFVLTEWGSTHLRLWNHGPAGRSKRPCVFLEQASMQKQASARIFWREGYKLSPECAKSLITAELCRFLQTCPRLDFRMHKVSYRPFRYSYLPISNFVESVSRNSPIPLPIRDHFEFISFTYTDAYPPSGICSNEFADLQVITETYRYRYRSAMLGN